MVSRLFLIKEVPYIESKLTGMATDKSCITKMAIHGLSPSLEKVPQVSRTAFRIKNAAPKYRPGDRFKKMGLPIK